MRPQPVLSRSGAGQRCLRYPGRYQRQGQGVICPADASRSGHGPSRQAGRVAVPTSKTLGRRPMRRVATDLPCTMTRTPAHYQSHEGETDQQVLARRAPLDRQDSHELARSGPQLAHRDEAFGDQQSWLITRTGHVAWVMTCSRTEPGRISLKAPWPLLPKTSSCAPTEASSRTCAGRPKTAAEETSAVYTSTMLSSATSRVCCALAGQSTQAVNGSTPDRGGYSHASTARTPAPVSAAWPTAQWRASSELGEPSTPTTMYPEFFMSFPAFCRDLRSTSHLLSGSGQCRHG